MNFVITGLTVRRKRTKTTIRAYLSGVSNPWLKPGTVILRDAQFNYLECINPYKLKKFYLSEESEFGEFLLKAKELYSEE